MRWLTLVLLLTLAACTSGEPGGDDGGIISESGDEGSSVPCFERPEQIACEEQVFDDHSLCTSMCGDDTSSCDYIVCSFGSCGSGLWSGLMACDAAHCPGSPDGRSCLAGCYSAYASCAASCQFCTQECRSECQSTFTTCYDDCYEQ